MAELYRTETLMADVDMADFVENCVDVPLFLGYCKQCGNYGKRWACPPFDFDPLTIWQKYSRIHIESRVLYPLPGVSLEQAVNGMAEVKLALLDELMAMERNNPGAMALSAGSCYVCPGDCARVCGKPCRLPQKMRYSMEAIGGDVNKAADIYLHKPIQWIKNGEMPEYLELVLGLLLP